MRYTLLALAVVAWLADADNVTWSDWSTCTASCGKGLKLRTRECGTEACKDQDVSVCSVEQCPATEVNLTAGGWSPWMDWYDCTVTCGRGVRMRERKCNNPTPSPNGEDCKGNPHQMTDCRTYRCTRGLSVKKSIAAPAEKDGGWSPWQPWYKCTVSCGSGVKLRERSCDNPPPTVKGRNNECLGESLGTSVCNTDECPVPVVPTDGDWSDWLTWSTCSKTCGGGVRLRERRCDNPSPGNKGRDCVGAAFESSACNTDMSCRYRAQCPYTTHKPCYWPYVDESYLGTVSTTEDGEKCIRWEDTPINKSSQFPGDAKVPENHCRVLGDERPWCYWTESLSWAYCRGIPKCDLVPWQTFVPPCDSKVKCPQGSTTCYRPSVMESYLGSRWTTETGRVCQSWVDQTPHDSGFTELTQFPGDDKWKVNSQTVTTYVMRHGYKTDQLNKMCVEGCGYISSVFIGDTEHVNYENFM